MLFIECQGYKIDNNLFYQNNKSENLPEVTGKRIVSKIIQVLNNCYNFMTDKVEN